MGKITKYLSSYVPGFVLETHRLRADRLVSIYLTYCFDLNDTSLFFICDMSISLESFNLGLIIHY